MAVKLRLPRTRRGWAIAALIAANEIRGLTVVWTVVALWMHR